MKTQKKPLVFKKNSISELNTEQLIEVNGGTTPLCLVVSATAFVWTYYGTGTKEIIEDVTN